jgi:hypothetical protein
MVSKQIRQPLRLDSGTRKLLLAVERVAQCRIASKVMQAVGTLVATICRRRRREAGESFMPRKSHEDEARLEFERFLYW